MLLLSRRTLTLGFRPTSWPSITTFASPFPLRFLAFAPRSVPLAAKLLPQIRQFYYHRSQNFDRKMPSPDEIIKVDEPVQSLTESLDEVVLGYGPNRTLLNNVITSKHFLYVARMGFPCPKRR